MWLLLKSSGRVFHCCLTEEGRRQKCRCHHPMGWGPEWMKSMWAVSWWWLHVTMTSHSHTLSCMMGRALKLSQNKVLVKLFFMKSFVTAWRKITTASFIFNWLGKWKDFVRFPIPICTIPWVIAKLHRPALNLSFLCLVPWVLLSTRLRLFLGYSVCVLIALSLWAFFSSPLFFTDL